MKKKEEGDFELHCGDKKAIFGLVMLAAWALTLGDWASKAEPPEPEFKHGTDMVRRRDNLRVTVRRTDARWFLPWHVKVLERGPDASIELRVDEAFCWTERGAERAGRKLIKAERARRARQTLEREIR